MNSAVLNLFSQLLQWRGEGKSNYQGWKQLKGYKRNLNSQAVNRSDAGTSTTSQSVKCKIYKVNACLQHPPATLPAVVIRKWKLGKWNFKIETEGKDI